MNRPEQGTWHAAASLSALKDDEPLGVEIGGHRVALYRVGSEYYATGNVCTHAEALLSDGILDGCEIECPLHMGRFDIRTGEALTSPVEIDIPIYPVRVAGETLEVCLPG
jgi:nitrite reductase/ring-hydroxylating ferredoxin subunit